MYIFDLETLGTESTSVILSAAILYVDTNKPKHTIESLREDTLFVKFKVKEQVEVYSRVVDKTTVAWWNKQCDIVKGISFFPSKSDILAVDGITQIKDFIASKSVDRLKELIWIRGSLDSMAIDSLCRAAGQELIMPFYNYRDIRTFICTNSEKANRGYCDIDLSLYPEYDKEKIMKHNPIDDIVLDALMLLYGK